MIREAKESDLPQIKELMKLVINSLSKNYDKNVIDLWHRTLVHRIDSEFPFLTLIVYETKNEIIGMGALKNSHIERVYVNPKHQNKGIGTMIMNKLEEIAKRKGITQLDLNTTINALSFYENRDYKKIGLTTYEKNGLTVSFTKMIKKI